MKRIKFEDLTEIQGEVTLHQLKHKKFTLLITIVHGEIFIRYGVYRGDLCVLCTINREKAWDKYVSMEDRSSYEIVSDIETDTVSQLITDPESLENTLK